MKIAGLIDKLKEHQLSLPKGTGRNSRVVAMDLENALGDYYLPRKYKKDSPRGAHCTLRREFVPMKAFRYDKLHEEEKADIFADNNDWKAERKYNGWRVMITYLPYAGFAIWGGNVSDVDFLPVDYTDHVRFNDMHPSHVDFRLRHTHPFVIDAEAVCFDEVEGEDGMFSSNTLQAIQNILGSKPERALDLQRGGATVIFKCFDMMLPAMNNFNNSILPLRFRKNLLHERLELFPELLTFNETNVISKNKKQYLKDIWVDGEEGIILKNDTKCYVNGGRHRDHNIKVKRTMSGEIGDDVDAFISGYELTDEWTKQGLIGSIKLSVYMTDAIGGMCEHWIATVSGMPTEMRRELTYAFKGEDGGLMLNQRYLRKVLVVDGQELSSKNKRIMHARVDWDRGFREDKRAEDCQIKLKTMEKERF